ncbi:MbtH family protein [Chitinimonas lacunae]|uniref:MbtH family protein n=1 Tax=Chitinimonas lacunae TaxID=1963018 RepID=A0ABV8MQ07_9NEIS
MEQQFVVVMNHEEQYSIWPADQTIPAGWSAQNCQGDKETCLQFIRENWTDMTPASLRRAMATN